MSTSAERNRAYRARNADNPEYRAKERKRVADWRKRVGWRRACYGPDWEQIAPAPRRSAPASNDTYNG